jgi:hypothetical protein
LRSALPDVGILQCHETKLLVGVDVNTGNLSLDELKDIDPEDLAMLKNAGIESLSHIITLGKGDFLKFLTNFGFKSSVTVEKLATYIQGNTAIEYYKIEEVFKSKIAQKIWNQGFTTLECLALYIKNIGPEAAARFINSKLGFFGVNRKYSDFMRILNTALYEKTKTSPDSIWACFWIRFSMLTTYDIPIFI